MCGQKAHPWVTPVLLSDQRNRVKADEGKTAGREQAWPFGTKRPPGISPRDSDKF